MSQMIDRQALFLTEPFINQFMRWRLATREDVVPGAKLGMIHVNMDGTPEWGMGARDIVIDEDPLRRQDVGRGPEDYVFYHAGETQCFVPITSFCDEMVGADTCGPHLTTLYLAPRR